MTENFQTNNQSRSFVIIGGGVTGLFIAWRLCQKGFKVTLLEYQKFLGGLSTSIKHNEYLLDIGPHELLFPKDMSQSKEIKHRNLVIKLKNMEINKSDNWRRRWKLISQMATINLDMKHNFLVKDHNPYEFWNNTIS